MIDDGKYLDIAIPENIGKKHASRTVYLGKHRQPISGGISQSASPRERK